MFLNSIKQVFSRKFISKSHIISIYSVKNDGKLDIFLCYLIHKIASDRGNHYEIRLQIAVTNPVNQKKYSVCNMEIPNCLERFDKIKHKEFEICCSKELLHILLTMMNFTPRIVEVIKSSGEKTTVRLSASHYTINVIFNVIKDMVSKTYYRNLSKQDAEEILSRLDLLSLVYCVESDQYGTLVVLPKVEFYYGSRFSEQPSDIFQRSVYSLNLSRTVVVSSSQCDRLLSREMESSVEFRSVRLDGRIELVFKTRVISTILRHFHIKVKIDNCQNELDTLQNELKQFEEQSSP